MGGAKKLAKVTEQLWSKIMIVGALILFLMKMAPVIPNVPGILLRSVEEKILTVIFY